MLFQQQYSLHITFRGSASSLYFCHACNHLLSPVCSWIPRTPSFLTWNAGRLFWSEPPQKTRPSRWMLPCWAGARCSSWRSSQWRRCCRSWTELWPRWGSESWSEIRWTTKIKTKQLKKSKRCPGDQALTDACHDLVLPSHSQSIGLTGRSGLCSPLREIINGMEWFLSSQSRAEGIVARAFLSPLILSQMLKEKNLQEL